METDASTKIEPADAVAVAMEAADAVDDSKSWEVAAGAESGENNVMHAVLTADGRTVAISYDPETGQYVTENGEAVIIQQEQAEMVTPDAMDNEPGDLITVEAQMADLSEAPSENQQLLESASPTSSNVNLALSAVDSASQGQPQIRYINASTGQEVSQPQQIRLVNADGTVTEVRTGATSVAMAVQRNASSSIRSPTGQIRIVRMDGTTVQQVQQPQQQQQQVRIFNADGTLTNLSGNVRVISSSQLLQQQLGAANMAGKQIRVVRAGSSSMGGAVTNSPTKTITLAQAQQMGLLSPSKVRNIQLSPVKSSSGSTQEVKQIVIRSAGNGASAQAQSQQQVIRIPASSLQPGTIQQLQVGNRVQYVRVIGQTQGNQVVSVKSGSPITPASTASKPTSTIPVGVKNLKVAIPSNTKTVGAGAAMPAATAVAAKPQQQQTQQRVILPSGQTFKAIVPQQMPEASTGTSTTGLMTNTYEAFASKKVERAATSASDIASESAMTTYEPSGVRPRKPCNCTKSQCLKLYCDCFANGEFCNNCNCNHCSNNLVHEEERQKAIKQCLDRNPSAFKPKIGRIANDGERRHNKGCNCKRSGCLKNYCECYEAKIPCTDACKCLGCKNVEEETGRKREVLGVGQQTPGVASLAAAANDHVAGRREHFLADIKPNLKSKLAPLTRSSTGSSYGGGPRLPFSFITPEVVEATCQCLLAQAEESERSHQSETEAEAAIIEEFGRCLAQIIEMANKTKVT